MTDNQQRDAASAAIEALNDQLREAGPRTPVSDAVQADITKRFQELGQRVAVHGSIGTSSTMINHADGTYSHFSLRGGSLCPAHRHGGQITTALTGGGRSPKRG